MINRKKSNRKEEDELKSLKEKLKKDLTIMTDVIKEYETFIEEKKNLINFKPGNTSLPPVALFPQKLGTFRTHPNVFL